ncbi:MAG: insulinase family protein [Pyrinomonadaceae bacterium]|nr:insulinase family protein [Phycisphaerales bacterium]
MFTSLKSFVLMVALSLACLPAAAQDVKYEKYKLPNGMTVILHEDHSLPVCAVNLWYHVGAKDELPGRSGFAHLYEHLMFMGTRRVPGNDFDVIMETGGGANNASTTLDRTNYFSSGPAKLLPTLLWLDADRLEDMGRTMSQDKLDRQRDIVRNEIRQNVENTPYAKASETTYRLMYPANHPYHNAVYGTHEDLEAATVGNVTDFFATYYVPRNVSLVVAGDFKSAEIRPLIPSLFGTLPGGADPAHRAAEPVKLDRVIRQVTMDDVQLPKIVMVYHSPAIFAQGDAEMDLLASVLTQGKTSRLYKRLVFDDQIAVDVAAYQNSAQLGSMFHIEITVPANSDLNAVEQAVDQEIERLLKDGIKADELEQRKSAFELGKLSQLQGIESKADQLNAYEFYFGEPNSFKRDLDRYRNATPRGVADWAGKILTPGARLIQRILPKDAPRSETPRDARPRDSADAAFEPEAPVGFTLANGVKVQFWKRDELPLVSMQVVLKPQTPINQPEFAGLASLTCDMLQEGTKDLDSLAFSDAMDLLGASFGTGADQEFVTLSLTVLKRNFEKAATLACSAVVSPRMDQSDWDRVKRLHLEDLKQSDDEPTVVAARVGMRALFGDTNPYGWPMSGTTDTVSRLNLDSVKAMHLLLFRPESAVVLLAGNLTIDEAKSALDRTFGQWNSTTTTPPAKAANLTAMTTGSGLRFLLVDRPDAVQTVIRYYMPGAKFADDRRGKLRLLNTILGGSFTSRLNQNLRERNGYAYGAGSRFSMRKSVGTFTASASVKADKTGASLKEFMTEFDRIRAGDITAEELTKAQETVRTDVIQSFQGLRGIVGSSAELVVSDMPFATISEDLRALQAIKASDLNTIAHSVIPLEQGVLVLVGDKQLIMEQIKDLGLPAPIEVDVNGTPVNTGE